MRGDGDAAYRRGQAILGVFLSIAGVAALSLLIQVALGRREQLLFPIWAAIFLAVVTPMTIIAIRHQIRLTRIKLIELFAKSFEFDPEPPQARPDPPPEKAKAGSRPARAETETDGTGHNVSFEFVKGKYFADLDVLDRPVRASDVPHFPMMLHADWMLLLCAIPYMVISGFGAFLLMAPLVEVLRIAPDAAVGSWLWPSMLALGGADAATIEVPAFYKMLHVNALTVALLAFSGAYFYSLRLLLRAVAVFDLSPVTFLRCFAHIVLAMLLAVVLYRVMPTADSLATSAAQTVELARKTVRAIGGEPQTPAASSQAAPTQPAQATTPPADGLEIRSPCASAWSCSDTDPTTGVKAIWLIIAFALGFVPDGGLQYLLQKSGISFKGRYKELDPHTKLIPLTIIDGVDNFIAFRLEEANVFDVQNLAASNPIMLHIESPYGIYQTIDWVAQAQLCTVVGADRFLLLKTLNIRTIFDLERAVLPLHARPQSDTAAPGASEPQVDADADLIEPDPALVLAIGEILLRDNDRDKAMRGALGLRDPSFVRSDAAPPTVPTVRHAVTVMIDDLHVHRLRQIWKHIAGQLGARNAYL
jgi:hypothetical protein